MSIRPIIQKKAVRVIDALQMNGVQEYNLVDDNNKILYQGSEVLTELHQYDCFYTIEDFPTVWNVFKSVYWKNYLRAYEATVATYNPIENYDRTERSVMGVHDGDITQTQSPETQTSTTSPAKQTLDNYYTTDENASARLDTRSITTYGDGNTATVTNAVTGSVTTVTEHSPETVYFDIQGQTEHEADTVTTNMVTIHGNIGVTSAQNMVTQEIDLRLRNLLHLIIEEFARQHFFYGGDTNDIDIVY